MNKNMIMATEHGDYVWGTNDIHRSTVNSITLYSDMSKVPNVTTTVNEDTYLMWDVSENRDGSVIAWVTESEEDETMYDLHLAADGKILANPDSCEFFGNFVNVRTLDLSNLDTSKVQNMCGMFYNCQSLETVNLESFNTCNVTVMRDMFGGCCSLKSLDISHFNVSRTYDMSYMFTECIFLKDIKVSRQFKLHMFCLRTGMFDFCPVESVVYCKS